MPHVADHAHDLHDGVARAAAALLHELLPHRRAPAAEELARQRLVHERHRRAFMVCRHR